MKYHQIVVYFHGKLGNTGSVLNVSFQRDVRYAPGSSISSIKALFHETDKYRSSFFRQIFTLFSQIAMKSHKNEVTSAGFYPGLPVIHANSCSQGDRYCAASH